MYDKAQGRINVVSLSMDNKKEAWLKAVKEESMPWKQVMISSGSVEKARNAYKLTTIPYLIIISPQGGVEFVSKNARSAVTRINQSLTE